MQNVIKFNIDKFGPINQANFDLNKLNIVGGVNASGKSFLQPLMVYTSILTGNMLSSHYISLNSRAVN